MDEEVRRYVDAALAVGACVGGLVALE